MTLPSPPPSRRWSIGHCVHAIGTVVRTGDGALELVIVLRPRAPRRLTPKQTLAYVIGRDRALRELEAELGLKLLLRAQI